MGFLALIVLFFTFPLGLFALGGAMPSSGTAEPVPAPKIAPARGSATLGVKSMRPVIVVGSGFKSRESVRISGLGTKRLNASPGGRFTVNLGGAADRCNGFTLVAVGSRGSRASLNFSQLLCNVQ
jgi:hypothetical protein